MYFKRCDKSVHVRKDEPTPKPQLHYTVTGSQLLEALENGVSKYPELEGRFPQLSGVSFE